MAREQRRDVDYFPHDCTHGRKMHIIETKYGNDGYATWFKLLEQLGKANDHYIDINDEMTFLFLVSTFKIDEEKTKSILNDLAKLGAIDKFLYENHSIIWSEKFMQSIADAYRKRKLKIFQYSDVLDVIKQKNGQSGGSLTLAHVKTPEVIPKEEKSRVEESKEEKSKVKSKSHLPKNSATNSKKLEDTLFWKKLVDQWFTFYKSKFIISPTFNAVQGKHFKSILTRFEKMALEKDKNEKIDFEWTEDRAIRTLNKFLENAWQDKWLQDHFLLKNLEQNFDAIINKTAITNVSTSKTRNRPT